MHSDLQISARSKWRSLTCKGLCCEYFQRQEERLGSTKRMETSWYLVRSCQSPCKRKRHELRRDRLPRPDTETLRQRLHRGSNLWSKVTNEFAIARPYAVQSIRAILEAMAKTLTTRAPLWHPADDVSARGNFLKRSARHLTKNHSPLSGARLAPCPVRTALTDGLACPLI